VRLFLAVNLDPEIRRAVVDASAPLRSAAPGASWMDETKLHLTLKFLSDQPETVVPPLTAMMDEVAGRHRTFGMRLAEVGAFPNFRRARVVWMGVEREPRLELLHHDVELGCEALGFEVEGRPFRPHLTLARIRAERSDVEEMRRLSRAGKKVSFEAETLVESIDLMKSVPGAGGSRYELLHASALKPR